MTYTPGPQFTQASALVFDENARVIHDGPTTGYNGYCHAEIAASTLRPLVDTGVLTEDALMDAVAAFFGEVCVCPCECDDAECSDCHPDADDTNGTNL